MRPWGVEKGHTARSTVNSGKIQKGQMVWIEEIFVKCHDESGSELYFRAEELALSDLVHPDKNQGG